MKALFGESLKSLMETQDLQYLILHLPIGPRVTHMEQTMRAILDSLRMCEIPCDEKGIIVDRAMGQILVPVKVMLTEAHLSCLQMILS
jgi:hypothetical protein